MRKIFAVVLISIGISFIIDSIIEASKNTHGDYGTMIMIPFAVIIFFFLFFLSYGVLKKKLWFDILCSIIMFLSIFNSIMMFIDRSTYEKYFNPNPSLLNLYLFHVLLFITLFIVSIFFIREDIRDKTK